MIAIVFMLQVMIDMEIFQIVPKDLLVFDQLCTLSKNLRILDMQQNLITIS